MKLWVDPESMSAMKDVAPRHTWSWIVLLAATPATACREKTGAAVSGSSAVVVSSVISNPPM
jgi:hypothetical protein